MTQGSWGGNGQTGPQQGWSSGSGGNPYQSPPTAQFPQAGGFPGDGGYPAAGGPQTGFGAGSPQPGPGGMMPPPGGPGVPGGPGGKDNSTKWILGGLGIFILIVFVGAGVIIALNSGGDESTTASPTTSESAAPSPSETATTTSAAGPTSRLSPGGGSDSGSSRSSSRSAPDSGSSSATDDHEQVLDDMYSKADRVYSDMGLKHRDSLDSSAHAALDAVEAGEVKFEPESFYDYAVDSYDGVAAVTIRVPHDRAYLWILTYKDTSDPGDMSEYGLATGWSDEYYYVAIAAK